MSKTINIAFNRYTSVKELIYRWFSLPKNAPLHRKVRLDHFGKKRFGTVREAIRIVEKRKYWGFCYIGKRTNHIHYWIHRDAKPLDIVSLFVHEVAHCSGKKSENYAMTSASIATFAVKQASRFFGTKIKLIR